MDNLINPVNVIIKRCPHRSAQLQTTVFNGQEACVYWKSNIMEYCTSYTFKTDYNLAAGYKRS